MCILRFYSETTSFKGIAEGLSVPVYSVNDKGDSILGRKDTELEQNCIQFDLSEADWDEFEIQVKDAISFLAKYESQLTEISVQIKDSNGYLDFPIASRIGEGNAGQFDHLPKQLVGLCGRIGLGIEMSYYDEEAFDRIASERNVE